MRVLVVGSGAREHAIVHAMRRSPGVKEVFAAPGNPGIAQAADNLPIAADDIVGLTEAACDLKADLTVVGPEIPLALGIADEFSRRGLRVFGPNRLGAELESSKVFAKEFCQRHGIATAAGDCVRTKDEAAKAVKSHGLPVVLKADGLAAGKGVTIVRSQDELDAAFDLYFEQRKFGDAGKRVLVEECLEGEELSYMVISDGTRVVPLATSHDYKRALNDDQGPNTGGMGSHSPAVLSPGTSRMILDVVVRPTIAGMAKEGREYRGILYVGLMLTESGPKVLEFNCRLGDPEAQSILLRLDDNLATRMREAAEGKLSIAALQWRREAVACVVLAAAGYPAAPKRGDEIHGIEDALSTPGVTVYHAGTKLNTGTLCTNGGRVLSVCGRGASLAEAIKTTYSGVKKISFDGMHYRTDICADTLAKLGGSGGTS
jgi:phosphoribosylamine--glycine ligase